MALTDIAGWILASVAIAYFGGWALYGFYYHFRCWLRGDV